MNRFYEWAAVIAVGFVLGVVAGTLSGVGPIEWVTLKYRILIAKHAAKLKMKADREFRELNKVAFEKTERLRAKANERSRNAPRRFKPGDRDARHVGRSTSKQKTLQPHSGMAPQTTKAPIPKDTAPLSRPFEHIFYGRALSVGEYRIVEGLSNGQHRLEIVQNQMYVDNKVYRANTGDLERIKTLIREAGI